MQPVKVNLAALLEGGLEDGVMFVDDLSRITFTTVAEFLKF